jgi:hypothetical protein
MKVSRLLALHTNGRAVSARACTVGGADYLLNVK